MIEIVAIFVACQVNLLVCRDLPFSLTQHTFENMDQCKVKVTEILKKENKWRKDMSHDYPIVMGKCKFYLKEPSR